MFFLFHFIHFLYKHKIISVKIQIQKIWPIYFTTTCVCTVYVIFKNHLRSSFSQHTHHFYINIIKGGILNCQVIITNCVVLIIIAINTTHKSLCGKQYCLLACGSTYASIKITVIFFKYNRRTPPPLRTKKTLLVYFLNLNAANHIMCNYSDGPIKSCAIIVTDQSQDLAGFF